jgi:GntR family transcriptional regulator/MocR family aminotransferase
MATFRRNILTSRTTELLISLDRSGRQTLGNQLENQIRDAIREGNLRPDSPLPSTRDLAAQLGISRPLVVDAYSQLAAEGFLAIRQGARPTVSSRVAQVAVRAAPQKTSASLPRFDFRPAAPDLRSFPIQRWLKAERIALAKMSRAHFDYDEAHGREVLRRALADYLGRVRGVLADPTQIVITSGFEQGRNLVCRALAARGAKRIGVENPSYTDWEPIRRTGLEIVPIPVDGDGMRVDLLDKRQVSAVMLTPAHQFPTGVVMSGERRVQLQDWLRRRDAIALEDDYDSEFRYDRAPVRALQGLEPERVVYAGTASKTLAPALRLGWLIVPRHLLAEIHREQLLSDLGCPRIEQHTLAEFIVTGEFDRHLRRMRSQYRARRDALLDALATELPEASVEGIAAGLHATIRLPDRYDEKALRPELSRVGISLWYMSDHFVGAPSGPPTLLIGYARISESQIRAGIRALAAAIRATFS